METRSHDSTQKNGYVDKILFSFGEHVFLTKCLISSIYGSTTAGMRLRSDDMGLNFLKSSEVGWTFG